MKLILIVVILLVTSISLSSQSYDGELILHNRKKIEAQSITINKDDITFLIRNDNKLTHIDKSEVRMLRVEDGNYAFEGFMLGAATGFVIYLGAVGFDGITSDGTLYSMGLGSFFGFIGGIATSRIRTIRIDSNSSVSLFDNINFIPETNTTNFSILNFNYKF